MYYHIAQENNEKSLKSMQRKTGRNIIIYPRSTYKYILDTNEHSHGTESGGCNNNDKRTRVNSTRAWTTVPYPEQTIDFVFYIFFPSYKILFIIFCLYEPFLYNNPNMNYFD